MERFRELGPRGADKLLAASRHGVLGTTRSGGPPHLVPVVFAGDSRTLWFAVDGKPKRGGELARIRNIRRDPRVTLLIDHYEDDWQRLWWLRLEGGARLVDRGSARARSALEALSAKYPQYQSVSLGDPGQPLVEIEVRAIEAWCAGTWADALAP